MTMNNNYAAIISDDEASEVTYAFDSKQIIYSSVKLNDSVRNRAGMKRNEKRRTMMRKLYIRHFGVSLSALLRSKDVTLYRKVHLILKTFANSCRSDDPKETARLRIRLKECLGEELWAEAHANTKISLKKRVKILQRQLEEHSC